MRSFCDIAAARGLQYAWANTCCIDKANRVELVEALNSMGRWYEQAAVCIVYLDDVSSSGDKDAVGDVFQQFEDSTWFTRSWTLQELLSPRKLIFYSVSWERIGSLHKDSFLLDYAHTAPLNLLPNKRGFHTSLERASHITMNDLCIADQYRSASVAQRMFWASHRVANRQEDISYSLLNLFGVRMRLDYGEGSNAFLRLQKKVMKQAASDESIFAWTPPSRKKETLLTAPSEYDRKDSVFATSPSDFQNSNDIDRTPINLDRALVVNGNGIDIYRQADHLCIFRRQIGQCDEQLLFIMQLGCERSIPGQLADPCVMALLAEMNGLSASNEIFDTLLHSPITIQRRIMNHGLSRSRLADMGFEPVETERSDRYHFWLPYENVLPNRRSSQQVARRRIRSRL